MEGLPQWSAGWSAGWLVTVGVAARQLCIKSHFFSQWLGLSALVHQIPPHMTVCWCVGLLVCEPLWDLTVSTTPGCKPAAESTASLPGQSGWNVAPTHQEAMWADESSVLLPLLGDSDVRSTQRCDTESWMQTIRSRPSEGKPRGRLWLGTSYLSSYCPYHLIVGRRSRSQLSMLCMATTQQLSTVTEGLICFYKQKH